jgi:hypothetical protein
MLRLALSLAVLLTSVLACSAAELPIPPKPSKHAKDTPPITPPPQGGPQIRALGTFPPLKVGQTEYVITLPDATGVTIQKLYIPKNVTLKAAPDVTRIDWSVEEFIFEENATIDLSSSAPKAARGGDGGPPGIQAPYCRLGAPGQSGSGGGTGQSGASLTIRDLRSVRNLGSLWVRTDAAPGGDGGNGGQGQQGGGHDRRGISHCNARDGGPGGNGGPGGQGGATSPITLSMRHVQDIPKNAITAGCAPTCQASTRPPGATGDTGVISIWGAPGCGGNGGGGGPGGLEGDRGESIPGGNGSGGGPGPLGSCSPVEKWGALIRLISSKRR